MKPRKLLWVIIFLVLLSVWVNLPSTQVLPGQVNVFNKKISLEVLQRDNWEIEVLGKRIDLSFITPPNILGRFPIKLGLDLQGGTQLILRTDMEKIKLEDRDTALEASRQVIEKRVNLYGVSEAVVQSSKLAEERRILVELPGVKDMQTAVDLVGKTAQLEFREMEASPSAGMIKLEDGTTVFDPIKATRPTGLTGADLKKAAVTFGSSGKNSGPQVSIEFTGEGINKFAEVTKKNVGKPLAIFLDDKPIIWPPPTVEQEILGGSAVISGNFTAGEAKNLSIQLNAGALPVPIKILSQRQIAATLGESTIQKSLISGTIGIIAVMFFMVAYYGLYGVLADLALIIYTLVVLSIFRTGLFILPPVTLTVAGIAGLILSIGMAVDANILIFERMKEELRMGRKRSDALRVGFQRAWTSIRDSNVSSLITAAILYTFGTSVVKGFAMTLSIGVLVSMFSAITVTRTFLRLLPRFKER